MMSKSVNWRSSMSRWHTWATATIYIMYCRANLYMREISWWFPVTKIISSQHVTKSLELLTCKPCPKLPCSLVALEALPRVGESPLGLTAFCPIEVCALPVPGSCAAAWACCICGLIACPLLFTILWATCCKRGSKVCKLLYSSWKQMSCKEYRQEFQRGTRSKATPGGNYLQD